MHDPIRWFKRKLKPPKNQNRSLFKSARVLVRKKSYPVIYLPAYKWLLKRVQNLDDSMDTEVDLIYFENGTDQLNAQGLVHLHLLLAGELQLCRINYKWEGMPVVDRRPVQHKVSSPSETGLSKPAGDMSQKSRGKPKKSLFLKWRYKKPVEHSSSRTSREGWTDQEVGNTSTGSSEGPEPPLLVEVNTDSQ